MAQKHTINDIEKPMTTYGPEQGPNKRYRRLRHPTFDADVWTAKNPLLQKGEIGAEKDTHKIKVGDGITYWNDLPYVTSVGQPLSTADYQMGNSSGGWTTMSQAQQDALNSGATSAKINSIDGKLNLDGTNIMTGVLKMRASISFQCAIAPYWDGVGFYKLNDNDSVTLMASMESTQGFSPFSTNTYDIGTSLHKWKNLYLSGTAYVGAINNGFDIAVPVTNSADEFALKSQVDLKANSADLGTAAYTASTDYATAAQGALADTAVQPGDLATVATTGDYDDLLNKPNIPAPQVNSDWNANSGVAEILNKPTTLAGYGITDGANTDLSNLTSTGKNIANWSSNVTNCITEIPQDIKLELNNGTLTLKADSKCYLKTDTTTPSITIASDLTTTQTTNGTYFAIYNGSVLTTVLTTTYDYSSLPNTYSLPLAVITVSGGTITSIDQVFNGFGYIGSTEFALPGVKGLIPNGRNADGTLKNTEFTLNNILTFTFTSMIGAFNGYAAIQNDNGNIILSYDTLNYWAYDINSNMFVHNDEKTSFCYLATLSTSNSGVISNWNPKTAFRSVDYSDTGFIAHQAMPSAKYINLTLLGSGGRYDAPADGWFVAASDGVITMALQGNRGGITVNGAAGFAPWATLPVSKGAYVLFTYSSNQNNRIRFYYAEGAK